MAATPFGLRQVVLTPLDSAGALGTPVALPYGRTFSFEESEDYETLRGDDVDVAEAGKGPSVSWELESGGISLEALVVLNGGILTTTGITPDVVKTYQKINTDPRPRFKAEGRAISETGGDFHMVVYNCKASSSISGSLGEGSFWLTSASGKGIGRTNPADGAIYDFIENETAAVIA